MDPSVIKLNQAYRDFFFGNRPEVMEGLERMEEYLVNHHCTFRGVAMPFLLKPNFISRQQSDLLRRSVEVMSGALTKTISLYMEDRRVREIMGFSEREDALFRIDPGYSNPLVISRLDAFLEGNTLKFLEFNCDSPAGIAYADVMEDGFRELFEKFPFMDAFRISYARRQEMLLSSLLECYRQFRAAKPGMPEKPVVAIVDWADVSTYSEFRLHQKHFTDSGIETVICAPQDVSIVNGRAEVFGKEIHLIYKRVITRELLDRWDEVTPFLDAIRTGLVCSCNSFRSFIVGNKKVLSVITDGRFRHVFNEEELELIRQTVPWTRVLADTTARFQGEEVHLRNFILRNRDRLVLKPSNKYGGKDVFIGRETTPEKWEKIMLEHLEDHMWVVQEYVDIPTDDYPELDGDIRFRDKYVNINPFALNGKYSGTITRVSDSLVINVSAGGGLVPTLTAADG